VASLAAGPGLSRRLRLCREARDRLVSVIELGLDTNHAATIAPVWAALLTGPAYAIDDQTAMKVVNGAVEVVSEGHWKLLT